MKPHQFTFASPHACYAFGKSNGNRRTLVDRVALPNGLTEGELLKLFQDIEKLRPDRNTIAHTEAVSREIAERVHNAVIGTPGTPGLLHRVVALKPQAETHSQG
jgi:hypothetical protein